MNTKSLKRLFFTGLLVTLSISLASCDEITIDDDVSMDHLTGELTITKPVNSSEEPDISTYPQGVQDGHITLEYFETLMTFFDELEREGLERRQLESEGETTIGSENYEMVALERDFLKYLDSITYTPTNAVEEKIHEQLSNVITHSSNMANYRMKYYSGESHYKNLIDSENELYLKEAELLMKTMNDYDLFLEE